MDVRAHGRSVVGSEGIGRRLAAHDLATVLDALDLRDVVLVGHSMGGMIIGEFCATYPETRRDRVSGLVFVSTTGGQPIPPALARPVKRVGARIETRLEAGKWVPKLIGEGDRSLLLSRSAFGRDPSGIAVEQVRRYNNAVEHRYYIPLWIDLFDYDGREALERVEVPALVLVGSRDGLTPVAVSRRLASYLSRGELHVLPGAGHQLMQERPHAVSDHIGDFAAKLATE
jgi:pimeloyl-ACP methyl ester carboxylesterase